ncbi:ParE toxin of type II toxin-antitoxin system, parDE [Pseudobutyrivibrio sp. ACV-2]|uniref:type II toxin-antitoxin system RelE/ParE family toxin n=1 Tax=Pseudobutyrivibrio sp. ACV-2 TaxID=1520801 RepID=UPI000897C61F|nr:type II toxin-antitoxin system RelE/ParE family toxin [Pseudobutyrivibrio sp. ACV-2]SEA49400.1 ParE toxin of type II toxin-antitoxin system, parDE [Pseudobutyrivibrio sp. ACV-2]
MKYKIIRTDTADSLIRKIILYVAENFGNDVALEKLDELEKDIMSLGDDPYIGVDPKYAVLRRQGYKVLITKMDLVFYKIDEKNKVVTVYAVVDHRQDYLSIIRGL